MSVGTVIAGSSGPRYRPVNQAVDVLGARPEVRADALEVGAPLRDVDRYGREICFEEGGIKSLGILIAPAQRGRRWSDEDEAGNA
jgi:hypothetical protein